MRDVMARAEVGDDVLGDDPTVRELESETAALLGKEAALFVPPELWRISWQFAARRPGDEIIVEANAHIYYYEGGGPAALSGVMCRCLEGSAPGFSRGRNGSLPATGRYSLSTNPAGVRGEIRIIAAAGKSGRWRRFRKWRDCPQHELQLHLDSGALMECSGRDRGSSGSGVCGSVR